MKNLLILGSTGSIGESTLKVVDEHRDRFNIKTLIANSSVQKLADQAMRYDAENVCIVDHTKYQELKTLLITRPEIKIYSGISGMMELMSIQYHVTIAAIVGMACLKPIMAVLPNTRILGLANKESIVCAGSLLLAAAKKHGTKIVPVDSEHSAVFQIIEDNQLNNIEKVILTASGGPFYNRSTEEMRNVTVADAVAHPTWSMGSKISIDSATLMNKGLELIEAHYLFDIPSDKLDAIVHPQSLVHAFVQYADGSMLAQIGVPDMRTPISIALNYPERLPIQHQSVSWDKMNSMQFIVPDEIRFPCLRLAKEVMRNGQCYSIALNTANELAVQEFMDKRISFLQISEKVEDVLHAFENIQIKSIEDVLNAAFHAQMLYNRRT